jgi:hypothetical protein
LSSRGTRPVAQVEVPTKSELIVALGAGHRAVFSRGT